MRETIRKILRESVQISDDAPEWVKVFHTLPREGRIAQIKKNKRDIERMLPKIVDFFENKLGYNLVKLEVINEEGMKGVHYGNENYSTNKIGLVFFFRHDTPNPVTLRKEIMNDLKSFFNIDITYYGTPLDLDFYKEVWQKF